MKVLVTGVTGFIGGRVAQRLAAGGHHVRGFVRDPARWTTRPEAAEVAVGDVTDRAAVERAVDGCAAVVHAAAFVKIWARDRRSYDRVNVQGLSHITETVRDLGAKLVYLSSFVALGPTDGRTFDEDTPRDGTDFHNDYERTKWVADQLARHLAGSGQDVVRLYPGVVYGPGSLTQGNHVVGLLLDHARGKLPGMLGAGTERQCFAYIDDVTEGIVRALESAPAGSAYILGGENRTAVDLFTAFAAASGIAPPRRRIPFGVAAVLGRMLRWRAVLTGIEPQLTDEVVGIYRHEWAYSSQRATRELGYRITPLDTGIARTVAWLREIGELPAAGGVSLERSELARKSVHVAMGGCALLLRWLQPWQAQLLALGALVFNLSLLHRLTGRSLLRPAERARGFSLGIALYPAVVLALLLVFRQRLELAAAAWGLLAFGDGMATVAGLGLGGPRLAWNRAKTWSGLAAFVLYGTAASAFLVRWTQQAVLDGAGPVTWIGGSFLHQPGGSALSDRAFLLLGCLAAATLAALAESLDSGVDDNLLVPLVGGAALYGAALVEPARLAALAPALQPNLIWGAAVNAALAVAAYAARSVSRSGAVVGWVLGTSLFAFAGWRGFLMLLVFFVIGSATTKVGYAKKAALGIAQERGGRRGAPNALANTTTGVLCAFLAVATPYTEMFTLAMAAAFATATCDTASSEIGQAFGRRHYLITTFRSARAGTDGAVSVEGTLGGIAAAAALAVVAWLAGLVGATGAVIVVVAAFFGATLESYVGAAFTAVGRIDNELVNFANTLAGAIAAGALHVLVT